MKERAALLLEGTPGPMSSLLLAREILGLAGGSESACAALLEPVLAGDPRFERTGQGAWQLSEAAPSYIASLGPPLRERAWAVWSSEPHGRAAAVVRLERGRIVEERCEIAGGSATPDADRRSMESRLPRPSSSSMEEPDDAFAPSNETLDAEALDRLATSAGGALWVTVETMKSFATLRRRLTAQVSRLRAVSVRSLMRLAVPVLCGAPPRSLEETAARLGLTVVSSDDPRVRARVGAECLRLLLDHPSVGDLHDPDELDVRLRAATPAPSFAGKDFDAERLRALPTEPGTYRFYDRTGALIYVGKARNLRARVGSYFSARRTPDPRTDAWLPAVHRFEIERSGSELEALLREAELIVRSCPAGNVQRIVHDRPARPSGDLLLLLPAPRGRAIRVHLIRQGRLMARVLVGPKGAGRRRLRTLIEAIYFTAESSRNRPSRRRPAGNPHALIASWLKRQPGLVPAFDPTDSPGPEEAFDRALRYAESARNGDWAVVHR